ncbi:MAG: allantoate deiminase [Pseudonocardiales bacterium]|jgi:allantoate deiminase|nr:allantoate deiminase [Pseudonocardiales bacterium]
MTGMLDAWLDELALIGGNGRAVNRFAWTPELLAASRWLVQRLHELGLEAEIDPAGNVLGRWQAGDGPAVLVGSHLDTVPEGGRFDGALGVLSALEAIRRLKDEGFEPAQPLWIAAFNDEEGTRFGTTMFGSAAFVGDDQAELRDRVSTDGVPLSEAMRAAGFDFDLVPRACLIGSVGCYLELHIEQGPRMELQRMDTAVVTGIVGVRGYRVELRGETNHAGTTPMENRRDALAGASRVVLALRDAALSAGDITVNVGRIDVQPGGTNVVPGTAVFFVDARAADPQRFASLDALVRECVGTAAAQERLTIEISPTHEHPPTPMDPALQQLLGDEMRAAGLTWGELSSGAGHDAQVLARHVASAMLFVPSQGGISHSPDEFTPSEQREPGVAVLTAALRKLCSTQRP